MYGNLRKGFGALVRRFEVRIDEDEADYFISASSKDGHGHFFDMTISKTSGEIRNVAIGHEDPDDEMNCEVPDLKEEPLD